jgi:arylsulfatase A-like enzyme
MHLTSKRTTRSHWQLIAFLVVCLNAGSALGQEKPDILFIAIDDLNDWVGVLGGNVQTKTPNIDRLASQGMLFTNAHTVAPSCLPSRAALLTGVSPFKSGVYNQSGDWRQVPALQGLATLPGFFRKAGYRVVGGGKIFHAHTHSKEGFPGQQDKDSWDEFYPSFDRQLPDELTPPGAPTNGNPFVVNPTGRSIGPDWMFTGFDFSGLVAEDDAMGDSQVVGWVEKQLSQESDKPRFIAVGLYRPHLPWYVPEKYFAMHPLEDIKLPAVKPDDLADIPDSAPYQEDRIGVIGPTSLQGWVVKNDLWARAVQGYLASISYADAMVGRVLDALERSGRADRTIVVLWSDHGYHLGEKQRWHKQTLWEESTRVPLVFRAPGSTEAGSSSAEAVSLLDIYPTLVQLAGLKAPEHLDGLSLLPLIANPDAERDEPAITFWDYGNVSIRDDHYRFTQYADGSQELYDHDLDPNEWNNIIDNPSFEEVKNRLSTFIPADPAPAAFP